MTGTTYWICGMAAAWTLSLTGCDPAADLDDPGALEFRDGDGTWGTGKLNTNFLGINQTLPLDTIPRVDDPNASVRLHAVWSQGCTSTIGQPLPKSLYFTSNLQGQLDITLDDAGDLNPAVFTNYYDPGVTCTIRDNQWIGTVWGLILKDGQGKTSNHYLMILDRKLDENGTPIYKWGVYDGKADVFNPKSYDRSTCVEDTDALGIPQLDAYHAYLIKDLSVDPNTGVFSPAAAANFFIACRSGMVGKSTGWGYVESEYGMKVHELITRVGRADYCGTGTSFTQKGNLLQIDDSFGVSEFASVTFADEAAWDLETQRATCVTVPRHHPLRDIYPDGFPCGDQLLPACTPELAASAEILTKIAD